jgi:hypothetical protein
MSISDELFIATWAELQSPQAVADALNLDIRGVYRRRNGLVNKGFQMPTTNKAGHKVLVDKEKLNAVANQVNKISNTKLYNYIEKTLLELRTNDEIISILRG